jgi:Spy/CpxP family protein refolding chaperone
MITSRQRILWAGLLASAAFAASAQTPPPAAPASGPRTDAEHRTHKPRDGKFAERMQERRAGHLAELKAKLKLDASQEGAWTSFASAAQPPAPPTQRPDRAAARAEFEKLTTPQRLDLLQARQNERSALFAKHAEATKAFYAVLTPEQQKTFDVQALRHGPRGGPSGHHGPQGHRPPPPTKG